jgi:hypothetical protein
MTKTPNPPHHQARFVIPVVALLWGAAVLVSMLAATGGRLSMPLDDSFIFFQYARRLAGGAFLSYQPGYGATTGATSLLTVLVDTLGYLVGFHGRAMIPFALLLGIATFAWATFSAHRLGRRLCPGVAWLPPALLLTSGPLIWGFMSGMDLPLFVALALALAADWPEAGAAPRRRFFVIGALLGLARPDALFLILPALVLGLWRGGWRAWWALPAAAVALPYLLQWALTGTPESASMIVKANLSDPAFDLSSWLATGFSYIIGVVKGVFGGGAVDNAAGLAANNGSGAGLYIVPFALALVLLGLAPGAWVEGRTRRPGLHALLLSWLAFLAAAVAFTVPVARHWHRYLMPLYAFALPGIAVGADRLGRGVEAVWKEVRAGDGARIVGAILLLLSVPPALYFVVAFGRNSADIYFQHVELARRLDAGDPVHPHLLGINDAGALSYFGNYTTLDLWGLTSTAFRDPARLASAGIWEEMERLPPDRRPDVLAIYPGWFGAAFLQPHKLIGVQRLFRSSIAGGNPMNVYRADWSLCGSGDLPRDPAVLAKIGRARLVATVDVADLESEKAAGYRYRILDGAYENALRLLPYDDGTSVMDGGRVVSGGESFTVRGLAPGRPVLLVSRTHAAFRLRVETNGGFEGMWEQTEGSPGSWHEASFLVPGSWIKASDLRVRLISGNPHHSAYGSFHYWVYQP